MKQISPNVQVVLALIVIMSGYVYSQDDLGSWQSEGYPNGIDAPPNWQVPFDRQSVVQTTNCYPSFLVSNTGSVFQRANFRIRINPTESIDDDFFGFAIGFSFGDSTNSAADYLLVDWKKVEQNFDGSVALAGLAISRVTGIPTASFPEFWDRSGSVQELQRAANLGMIGWQNDIEYEFEVSVSSESVVISVNGSEDINLSGNFNDGSLAFYSNANAGVSYSTDFGLTNLESWSSNGYPSGDPPANWSLDSGQRTVFQSSNCEPSMLASDSGTLFDHENFQVQIEAPGDDDDFFGFALGYQTGDNQNSDADYLLVDWKRVEQNFDGFTALAGLAISRVSGVPNEPFPNFWDHSGQVIELQRATNLGFTGWVEGERYTFDVLANSNQVIISVNGVEEFNISNIEVPDGGFAFYAFAQAGEFSTNFGAIEATLLGDVNCDGAVDLLDVGPFVDLLTNNRFSPKADINQDGVVDLLDVGPFVAILTGA